MTDGECPESRLCKGLRLRGKVRACTALDAVMGANRALTADLTARPAAFPCVM